MHCLSLREVNVIYGCSWVIIKTRVGAGVVSLDTLLDYDIQAAFMRSSNTVEPSILPSFIL
jgi:hypothetical protein